MKITPYPHDRYFKKSMQDINIAKDFLVQHLPDNIIKIIELNSISVDNSSLIDKNLKLQESDVIIKTNVNNKPGYIYILIEHQSKPDKLMPLRLQLYIFNLMKRHLENSKHHCLPIIYPMVLYHGKEQYSYSTDIFDLFATEQQQLAKSILFSPFQLVDLGEISDQQLLQYRWAGIMELMLKHIQDQNLLALIKTLMPKLQLLEQQGAKEFVLSTLAYAVSANGRVDICELNEALQTQLPKSGDKIMTLLEESMERIIQQRVKERVEKRVREQLQVRVEEQLQERVEEQLQERVEEQLQVRVEEQLQKRVRQSITSQQQVIAERMLTFGADVSFIQQVTGLPISKINSLTQSSTTIQ